MVAAVLASFVVACGQGAKTGASPVAGGGGANTSQPVYSMTVSTDAELPVCGDANKKHLVYVTSTKTFKTCEPSGWVVVEIGGLRVVSNRQIMPLSENLCPEFSSIESCAFNGGQIVKYSDGSVLVTGAYSYEFYTEDNMNSGSPEYDRMTNSITMLVAPEMSAMHQRLDWKVSRPSGIFKNLFLVYIRDQDAVKLIFDSNSDGKVGVNDEVVHTALMTDWL
jgi:hypothetical protein